MGCLGEGKRNRDEQGWKWEVPGGVHGGEMSCLGDSWLLIPFEE